MVLFSFFAKDITSLMNIWGGLSVLWHYMAYKYQLDELETICYLPNVNPILSWTRQCSTSNSLKAELQMEYVTIHQTESYLLFSYPNYPVSCLTQIRIPFSSKRPTGTSGYFIIKILSSSVENSWLCEIIVPIRFH